jgi:uncharacterized protein YndB with AHSA1/START domain
MSLALLRYYRERHFGEPKRAFLAIEPTQYSPAEMLNWYTDPDLLGEWLAADVSGMQAPSAVGQAVMIPLADDGSRTITGETLAVTRREVAFSWAAEDLVLEFKAFMMGPNPVVSVRGTGWRADAGRFAAIEREMETALRRLAARLLAQPLGPASTTKV